MTHRNAPLSVEGRERLVRRCQNRPIAYVAVEMGISRACASKWVSRHRQFGDLGLEDRPSVPHGQPSATLSALADALPDHMDGRECVEEMRAADYSQWAQDEWAAFYFEYLGLPALINAFGGGPRQIVKKRFDYALGHTWDLKAHMAHSGDAPLNDQAAMEVAVTDAGGLGFIVMTGAVEYDEGDFRAWQREFRLRHGRKPRKRAEPPKYEEVEARFPPRHDRSVPHR